MKNAPRRPLVQAALALVERRGRYLICRRPRGRFLGGYWEFPGGKREPGESWPACLRRELREELGLAVGRLQPYGILRHRYPDRTVSLRVFRCALRQGSAPPRPGPTVRWVPAGQLRRYRFPPANHKLLERLLRRAIIYI